MDMMLPKLFAVEEANAAWSRGIEALWEELSVSDVEGEPPDTEDVVIWTSYGSGAWWSGRASRTALLIVEGVDPHGNAAEVGDPNGEEPREVHLGVPEWVPSDWRD